MKLQIVALASFAAGYVLGARAGTQRYRQIADAAVRIRQSAPVAGASGAAADKAKAVATLGAEWAKDLATTRLHRSATGEPDEVVELAVVTVSTGDRPPAP